MKTQICPCGVGHPCYHTPAETAHLIKLRGLTDDQILNLYPNPEPDAQSDSDWLITRRSGLLFPSPLVKHFPEPPKL